MRDLFDAELDIVGAGLRTGIEATGPIFGWSELSSLPKLISESTKGLGALFVIEQIVSTIFLSHDVPR
jgi:hypothetical protein